MDSKNVNKVALVTGANSGLGLEAAAQLAEEGFGSVIVTSRTATKAEQSVAELAARTGRDAFSFVTLDNGELDTVEHAAAVIAERGDQIDFLLLNAGIAPPQTFTATPDGYEATVASTLIGHHLLTMRLLEAGMLAPNARIVIAGSEAARGDVPTMNPADIGGFATQLDGSLESAIEHQIRMEAPATYKPNDVYATAKVFVAWWAASLARRLPVGMTVNAVSPGATPGTNVVRDAPFFMKYVMLPAMRILPGMSHSVADGAGRYLEAEEYDASVSGRFFASKPKKMTGPLVEIQMERFDDQPLQEALWATTTRLAGGVDYPATA